ncbi:hypothetical protein DMB44_09130, partial [Thermoplasma sp. Kam2015]
MWKRIAAVVIVIAIIFSVSVISWDYEPKASSTPPLSHFMPVPSYSLLYNSTYRPLESSPSFNVTFTIMGQRATYTITALNLGAWLILMDFNADIIDLAGIAAGPIMYTNVVVMNLTHGSDSYFDHILLKVDSLEFNISAYYDDSSIPIDITTSGTEYHGPVFNVYSGSNLTAGRYFTTGGSGKIFMISGLFNSNMTLTPEYCSGNFTQEGPGNITYANCNMEYGSSAPYWVPVYWVSDFNTTDHILVTPILEIGPYFITGEPVWINIEMSYPSEM